MVNLGRGLGITLLQVQQLRTTSCHLRMLYLMTVLVSFCDALEITPTPFPEAITEPPLTAAVRAELTATRQGIWPTTAYDPYECPLPCTTIPSADQTAFSDSLTSSLASGVITQQVPKNTTDFSQKVTQSSTIFPAPKIFGDDPLSRAKIAILSSSPSNQLRRALDLRSAPKIKPSNSSRSVSPVPPNEPFYPPGTPSRTARFQQETKVSASTTKPAPKEPVRTTQRSLQKTSNSSLQEPGHLANRTIHSPSIKNNSETFNTTLPAYLIASLNGTCDNIENSQEATNSFVLQFERSMAASLGIPEDHVHVWEITCGALVVNFSVIWSEKSQSFADIHRKILNRHGFIMVWAGRTYAANEVQRRLFTSPEQALSSLEMGPASGHVYQGFIYIIVGAVLGVILLVIATTFIVRLHRRKGHEFSVSGDSTPTKFSDVNDYTLTRLPRSTKLYMDDVERNPWAYSNPDFHGSTGNVAMGKKSEYVNFVNTGMKPVHDFSSADTSVTTTKTNWSGGKMSQALSNPVVKPSPSFTDYDGVSAKQKMFVDFHGHSIFGPGVASRTGSSSVRGKRPNSSPPKTQLLLGTPRRF